MTLEVYNEIPVMSITQDDVDYNLRCSVCYDDFRLGETVRKLICSHVFHTSCIIPWLQRRDTCPVCRQSQGIVPGLSSHESTVDVEDSFSSAEGFVTGDGEDMLVDISDASTEEVLVWDGNSIVSDEFFDDELEIVLGDDGYSDVLVVSDCEESFDGEEFTMLDETSDDQDTFLDEESADEGALDNGGTVDEEMISVEVESFCSVSIVNDTINITSSSDDMFVYHNNGASRHED